MQVYKYDPETGEYCHPVPLQKNPARPGEYLLPPANTLPATPMDAVINKAIIVNEAKDGWIMMDDYRGHSYYLPDGSFHAIDSLGVVPPPEALEQPPEPSAEVRKLTACQAIDTAAGEARKRIITDSALIDVEYTRTYNLAVEFINNNYTGEAPKPVKSHAESYEVTEQEAANVIKAIGENWFATLDLIRDIRLKGKKTVERSADDSDFDAIAQPFIDQLNNIQPELSA